MIIGFFKTLGILFVFIAFIGLITTIFVEAVVFIARAIEEGKRREDKGENT
jgi:cytochrome bd-type quinol oxidase subunit 1